MRPSYVESSVQKRTTSSVAHHLLASYQRAHIAIIKAQFTSKRLANGMSVRVAQTWALAADRHPSPWNPGFPCGA